MKAYYQDQYVTIYHGSCEEILPQLPSFDLLLTDPPYGIGADINQSRRANKQPGSAQAPSRDYGRSEWDSKSPPPWVFGLMASKSRFQIVWGGNYFPLTPSKCWLVWDKDNGTNDYADCELAWTNLPKAVRKFQWKWQGMLQEDMQNKEVRVHPTQKPLPLMAWCIGHVPDVKTIVDPYMGSGTTLRAAKDRQLLAVGIEREERYCEEAAKRMAQEVLSL